MRILKFSPGQSCKSTDHIPIEHTTQNREPTPKRWFMKQLTEKGEMQFGKMVYKIDDREGKLQIGRKEFLQHKQTVKSSS